MAQFNRFVYRMAGADGYTGIYYRLMITAKRRTATANKEDAVVNITIPLDAGK